MNRFVSFCVFLLSFTVCAAFAGELPIDMPVEDYALLPDYHPIKVKEATGGFDVLWDTVYAYNGSSLTGSVYIVGTEFDGSNFWVSSGVSSKYLYQINRSFTTILNSIYQLCSSSSWGWRDMAYDHINNYMYGGCERGTPYDFVRIDLNVNPPTITDLTAPVISNLSVLRGMAFDPATGHLWTSDFWSGLYEITVDGSLIFSDEDSELTAVPKYGLCWDVVTDGGPFIWLTNEYNNSVMQYSVASQSLTGVEHYQPLFGGNTYQYPGGLFIDEFGDLNPGWSTFGGLQQGDNDVVFGEEFPVLSTPTPSPTATPSATPTITPTPTATGTPPPLPALGSAGIVLLLLSMSGLLVLRRRK